MAKRSASSPETGSTVPTRWKHQEETFRFFQPRPRGNDFSDPGTGKTRAQIDIYHDRKAPGRWLIVPPLTLMYSAWAQDIEKFGRGITYALAYAEQREKAFQLGVDAVILNHDGIKWFFEKGHSERLRLLNGFDHLTMDESTAFKTPTSLRTKAMIKLRNHFKHRYAMTGTPNPNSVTELWAPMLIIDDGKRLGNNFFKFRNNVQTPHQRGPSAQHIEWRDKPDINLQIDEIIGDITIRHAFEDVMTHVPANHRETKVFELSLKAQKLYTTLETAAIAELSKGYVTAVHAAALRTKLLQIASGAVYATVDDGSSYQVVDRTRYKLIADLIEERDHSVTFFNWRHQRDELVEECKKRHMEVAVIDGSVPPGKARDQIVVDYQKGRYQSLLLHPKTGAHGLTLTRGDTTIISSPFYEADLLKQAIHRIYRGDQNKVTNTIFVRAANTVEDIVYDERLFAKEGRMKDLLELLTMRNN